MTSTRDSAAWRRLGGQMLVGFGLVLGMILTLALVGLDLRWASVAPPDQRAEVFERGVKTSLMWAWGTGLTVSLSGLLIWLGGRSR